MKPSLVVVQGAGRFSTDGNWLSERMQVYADGRQAGVSISPNVYTLTVNDSDVAPVAKFTAPSFTLTEGSERDGVVGHRRAEQRDDPPVPRGRNGISAGNHDGNVVVRVSNHGWSRSALRIPIVLPRPRRTPSRANKEGCSYRSGATELACHRTPTAAAFGRTARLATDALDYREPDRNHRQGLRLRASTIMACDVSGFRDPSMVTLTILPNNLVERPGARVEVTSRSARR